MVTAAYSKISQCEMNMSGGGGGGSNACDVSMG